MIYLRHSDGRIAACESDANAIHCAARGFERISRDLYIAYWRCNDRRAGAVWHAPVLQERAVGEKWIAPWVLRDMPKEDL